jgi:hypothetical protein
MPKNIIACTDGTWDHPDSKDPNVGTIPDETNVFKLFALLPGRGADPPGRSVCQIDPRTNRLLRRRRRGRSAQYVE